MRDVFYLQDPQNNAQRLTCTLIVMEPTAASITWRRFMPHMGHHAMVAKSRGPADVARMMQILLVLIAMDAMIEFIVVSTHFEKSLTLSIICGYLQKRFRIKNFRSIS